MLRRAWVAGLAGLCIGLTALSGSAARGTVELRLSIHGVAFSPDGGRIAFARDNAGDGVDVFCMDADGSRLRRLRWDVRVIAPISWSADGTRITYDAGLDSGPRSVSVPRRPGDGSVWTIPPAHPPFRQRAKVYARNDGREAGPSSIWIQPLDRPSRPIRLTSGRHNDESPVLSPDGRWVVFCSDRRPGGLWIMRSDGTGMRLLAPAADDCFPVWSPSSSLIAFTETEKRVHLWNIGQDYYLDDQMWTVHPDGTGLRQVTTLGPLFWDGTVSARDLPWILACFCAFVGGVLGATYLIVRRRRQRR